MTRRENATTQVAPLARATTRAAFFLRFHVVVVLVFMKVVLSHLRNGHDGCVPTLRHKARSGPAWGLFSKASTIQQVFATSFQQCPGRILRRRFFCRTQTTSPARFPRKTQATRPTFTLPVKRDSAK